MCDLGATIICCTPSYACIFWRRASMSWGLRDQIHLKAGIFGAEAWTQEMRPGY